MRNRIILLTVIFILFLFGCSKNKELLLFDETNNKIILSTKLIGRNLDIYKMKQNGEMLEYSNFDDGKSIIIEKVIYHISELGLKSGSYRMNVSYMGRVYYLGVFIK